VVDVIYTILGLTRVPLTCSCLLTATLKVSSSLAMVASGWSPDVPAGVSALSAGPDPSIDPAPHGVHDQVVALDTSRASC
jgi:hypothetical protein